MSSILSLRSLPSRVSKRLFARLGSFTVVAGSRKNLWAVLHYALVNRAFTREQRSFLAGRLAYHESLASPSGTLALLRRNIHRLEKGILMKPRRIPFATDYIGETVSAFANAVATKTSSVDPDEKAWANDVLSEYFEIHAAEPLMQDHRQRFEYARQEHSPSIRRIPYQRDLSKSAPVSFEDLNALAQRRRSVRWFLPRSVDRNLIDRALEVGAQAPSACNRQPFEFRFCDDRELVKKVINIPFGLAGYGHQVPMVAVVVGQQRHFFDERDRHLIYIDASLAVMGFILALETLGLSSCCVNWPDIESQEKAMADLLGLSPDERPVMCIAIGYPDPEGMVANSTKKSLAQLRRYNF